MGTKMKKKSAAPLEFYTKERKQQGIQPALQGKGGGWVLSTYPIEELLKNPGLKDKIVAILEDFKSRKGIDISSILHLPMLQVLKPENVFNFNGRPIVYIEYSSARRTRKGVSFMEPLGSRVLYLDTMEIEEASGTDPVTIYHDEIVAKSQIDASKIINAYFQAEHNRVVDYVCNNNRPPLQNVGAMLLKARRLMQSRIASLEAQVERSSQPRVLPKGISEMDAEFKSDMGISEDSAGISFSTEAPKRLINTIQDVFASLIISYWDRPYLIVNAYNSGQLTNAFRNIPNATEEDIQDISKALSDVMTTVQSDWDKERAQTEGYQKSRSEPKPEETKPTIDWALRKVAPIAEEQATKLVKRRSLVPDRFRGQRSYLDQGSETVKSIQATELSIMKETLSNTEDTLRVLGQINSELTQSGMSLSSKNLSPAHMNSLCQSAKSLQRFTEGYAKPLVSEKGNIDKRKMGYSKEPMANMIVSSYMGLCQHVLSKIACEGADENMQDICGSYNNEAIIE